MAIQFAAMAARIAASALAKQVAAQGGKAAVGKAAGKAAGRAVLGQVYGGTDTRTSVGRSPWGVTYQGGRGFTSLPTRTQAQQSTWGIQGPMASSPLAGFGALDLDRGYRGVSTGMMPSFPVHPDAAAASGNGAMPDRRGSAQPMTGPRPEVVPPIRATATYKRPNRAGGQFTSTL
jgi:hypothetical protein